MDNLYQVQVRTTLYFSIHAPDYLPSDWAEFYNTPLTVTSVRRVMLGRQKMEALTMKLRNPKGRVLTIPEAPASWILKWLVLPDEIVISPDGKRFDLRK